MDEEDGEIKDYNIFFCPGDQRQKEVKRRGWFSERKRMVCLDSLDESATESSNGSDLQIVGNEVIEGLRIERRLWELAPERVKSWGCTIAQGGIIEGKRT